jgi:hypothetical protein
VSLDFIFNRPVCRTYRVQYCSRLSLPLNPVLNKQNSVRVLTIFIYLYLKDTDCIYSVLMAVVIYIAVNWDIRPFSLVYEYHHFGEHTGSIYPEDCLCHFVLIKHWYSPSRLKYYSKASIRKHIRKKVRGGVINYTCQMYISVQFNNKT